MSPVIRAARRRDAASIGNCHAEAWRAAYMGIFPPSFLAQAVESRRRNTGTHLVRLLVDDDEVALSDGSVLLVAAAGATAVGFAHGGRSEETEDAQEIYGFYLHPEHWGSGIATDLWQETVALLRDRSNRPIVLWTLEGAGRARRFYERNGWTPTGRTANRDFGNGQAFPIIEYNGR